MTRDPAPFPGIQDGDAFPHCETTFRRFIFRKMFDIILIVIDALRLDGLSCYGNPRNTSPNIDMFARESAVFSQAISASNSTPGAMGALMTSKYPSFITDAFVKGVEVKDFGYSRFSAEHENTTQLPSSLHTFAEILSQNGYITAGFCANPILGPEFNFARGFAEYEEFERKYWCPVPNASVVTKKAIKWLSRRRRGNFFLFIHYMDIHNPYCPPWPYNRLFRGEYLRKAKDKRLSAEWARAEDPVKLQAIKNHVRALYDGQIRYLDRYIRELFRILEKKDRLGETLVILLSDHGDEFLEHGGTLHWPKLYDELVRVPLILHCPMADVRKRVASLVRTVDILPTILDVLSMDASEGFDGNSFLSVLLGIEESEPRIAYLDASYLRGVRTEKWKLIENEKENSLELYDLQKDPGETRNLLETEKEAADFMRKKMQYFIEKIESEKSKRNYAMAETNREVEEETIRRLKSLGYL